MSNNDRFSPSLTGNLDAWKDLVDFGRSVGPEVILDKYLRASNNSKEEFDFRQDGTDYIITSESERVKTLPQLIAEMDINEEEYEIYRSTHNKWDQHSVDKGLVELYQVKAWAKKKYLDRPDMDFYNDWLDNLSEDLTPLYVENRDTGKPIVVSLADLHTGGFSEEDILIPDYNKDIIRERLDYIAGVVNSYDRPVHLKILGDFIESFTGKNHGDTWKQIEAHGMEVSLIAFDLIREFILKLENLHTIDVIGGNHDRISKRYGEDKEGQVAYLIAELIKRFINGIEINYSPLILTSVHDNVCYIITHGDKRLTKKNPSEIILEYGEQDMYNVLLCAHNHEEEVMAATRKLRSHRIPPVCNPNMYAIENGYNGASGFVIIEANDFDKVDIYTKGL